MVVVLVNVHPVLLVAVVAPGALLVRRWVEVEWWRRAAMTDGLTGLWNSIGWRRHAAAVLASRGAADRVRCGPAVMVIDVDRFKKVNDTYGHPAGDAVLRAVGAALRGAVRAGDVVGRVGGDEFVVGLGAVTPAELAGLAERVRAAVGRVSVAGADATVDVSASVGAAVSPSGPAGVGELLAAADRALYEAKGGGRDGVRLAVVVAGAPHCSEGALGGRADVRPPGLWRRSWAVASRRSLDPVQSK